MLASLGRHHRSKLVELLEGTAEFTPEEVAVAIELVDAALAEPASDDYRFIICEEGERLLGYACFGDTPMTEGCFDLYWLVVDPSARRSGVARELLAAVEQALRRHHARLVRVETAGLDSYAPARALYENSGYETAARIRDFYHRGNDLYIYVKYLTGNRGPTGGPAHGERLQIKRDDLGFEPWARCAAIRAGNAAPSAVLLTAWRQHESSTTSIAARPPSGRSSFSTRSTTSASTSTP